MRYVLIFKIKFRFGGVVVSFVWFVFLVGFWFRCFVLGFELVVFVFRGVV